MIEIKSLSWIRSGIMIAIKGTIAGFVEKMQGQRWNLILEQSWCRERSEIELKLRHFGFSTPIQNHKANAKGFYHSHSGLSYHSDAKFDRQVTFSPPNFFNVSPVS